MKRFLSALLPAESREHVLGDLAERGAGLRDLLSVLPRVWLSHVRRRWFGPPPALEDASVERIRQRYIQIRRSQGFVILLYFAVKLWISMVDTQSRGFPEMSVQFEFWFCVSGIALLVVGMMDAQRWEGKNWDRDRDYWRHRYVQTLGLQTFLVQPYAFPVMLAISVLTLLGLPDFPLHDRSAARVMVGVPVVGAALAYGWRTRRRLLQELRNFKGIGPGAAS